MPRRSSTIPDVGPLSPVRNPPSETALATSNEEMRPGCDTMGMNPSSPR